MHFNVLVMLVGLNMVCYDISIAVRKQLLDHFCANASPYMTFAIDNSQMR